MSEENRRKILEEFEEHKGQFVITDSHDVQRLIAVGSGDWDYYWIYWDGRKTSWHTCVGGFIPLKGKIDDKHYDNLIRLAKLNHNDQLYLKLDKSKDKTKEALYKLMTSMIREKETRLKGNDEYITDICWDIK